MTHASIAHWFAHTVATAPPENGLVFAGVHTPYAELDSQVNVVANWYQVREFRRGDVVGILLPNCPELVLAHLAHMRIGAITLPLNTAYRAAELEFILDDAKAVALVTNQEGCALVQGIRDKLPGLREIIIVEEELEPKEEGVARFPTAQYTVMEDTPEDLPRVPIAEGLGREDTAMILYTSGTTGHPKGAPLSHGNIMANMQAVLEAWRITAADRFLLVLPMFHAHGLIMGLHGTLFSGCLTFVHTRFDAEPVLWELAQNRCTLFMGVPTHYFRLLRSVKLEETDLSGMRLFTSGSAPLDEITWNSFRERTGHAIVERYGLTETLFNTTNPIEGPCVPGTVGRPFPGVELRIIDGEGRQVAQGEAGEILVRGPNVFAGYLNRPAATAEAFRDGWFATGDQGRIRPEDGYLEILGRIKDLIITGGYNVYPVEVEAVLLEQPGVEECAVVGRTDEEWGETVHAFIVPQAGATLDEATLLAEAAKRLASYKCPRSVRLVRELPRNAMGKVQKNVLRDELKAGATA